jgi:hypothetical protein
MESFWNQNQEVVPQRAVHHSAQDMVKNGIDAIAPAFKTVEFIYK